MYGRSLLIFLDLGVDFMDLVDFERVFSRGTGMTPWLLLLPAILNAGLVSGGEVVDEVAEDAADVLFFAQRTPEDERTVEMDRDFMCVVIYLCLLAPSK